MSVVSIDIYRGYLILQRMQRMSPVPSSRRAASGAPEFDYGPFQAIADLPFTLPCLDVTANGPT